MSETDAFRVAETAMVARWRTKHGNRNSEVTVTRVHPEVWARALDLAEGDAQRIEVLGPGSVVVRNARKNKWVYLNCKVVSADRREVLVAVRPDEESAVAFMALLRNRLRRDPRTADIWDMYTITSSEGDSFVWLRSHSPPE